MYQQLCSWDNLLLAWRKAARGKRGHPNAAAFEYHLEDNLLELQHELLEKIYTPGQYHSFYIHDPKKRLISAAPFRDRVVHHALCNMIEPVFERSFTFDSYANRIGKGTHRALDRAQAFARRFKYVLTCDVRQFFPSIDHAILIHTLARKLSDPGVHKLVEKILHSGVGILAEEYEMVYFPGDDLFSASRPRGLPIGNLTSQFWANCYLNPFDHFVKRQLGCPAYVRYVDDFLLFSDDKRALLEWKNAICKRLASLRLTLHEGPAQARPVQNGFPFLGFILFPEYRRLKPARGIAFQRRYKSMQNACIQGRILPARISASVLGWVNHVRHANTWNLRKKILSTQPRRPHSPIPAAHTGCTLPLCNPPDPP